MSLINCEVISRLKCPLWNFSFNKWDYSFIKTTISSYILFEYGSIIFLILFCFCLILALMKTVFLLSQSDSTMTIRGSIMSRLHLCDHLRDFSCHVIFNIQYLSLFQTKIFKFKKKWFLIWRFILPFFSFSISMSLMILQITFSFNILYILITVMKTGPYIRSFHGRGTPKNPSFSTTSDRSHLRPS